MSDEAPLNLRPAIVDPSELTLLEVNARYMRKETFDQLVANVRRDGALTSTPLVWNDEAGGRQVVLSGNHRIMAAREAGLEKVSVIVADQPLSRSRQVALQLSHNSIEGEDDPATLKQLYDELDDTDWRSYSGLDDQQLKLLEEVSTEGLSEANLDFTTVQLVFLPPELEAARTALEAAKAGADQTWLAARADYETMLDALASVHSSHRVGNVATALHILISVAEGHLTDLQAGYLDDDAEPTHTGDVGLETVFGTRLVPASTATTLVKAIKAAERIGTVDKGEGWQLVEQLAEAYLAGVDADRQARGSL